MERKMILFEDMYIIENDEFNKEILNREELIKIKKKDEQLEYFEDIADDIAKKLEEYVKEFGIMLDSLDTNYFRVVFNRINDDKLIEIFRILSDYGTLNVSLKYKDRVYIAVVRSEKIKIKDKRINRIKEKYGNNFDYLKLNKVGIETYIGTENSVNQIVKLKNILDELKISYWNWIEFYDVNIWLKFNDLF